MPKTKETFSSHDWDCFHDTIYNATYEGVQKDADQEELD